MKKSLILLLILILVLPTIFSLNLIIEKQSTNEVLISGLDSPATFDLSIKNLGQPDSILFYNLLGFRMFPAGTTRIETGETKNIQLRISPIGQFDYRGYYSFDYYIQGQDGSELTRQLRFKIIDFPEAFEVGAQKFNPESNSLEIYVENKVNFNFEDLKINFSSPFFELEKLTPLGAYEKKTFEIELNKEDFKELTAGFYTLNAEITAKDKTTNVQGTMEFEEKEIVTTVERDYGFFVDTKIIEKVNEGNTPINSETIIKKNIISRLFTSFEPRPDIAQRKGFVVTYSWDKQIQPGQSLRIAVTTNWFFPFIIIVFIIVVVVLAKQYKKTDLILRKRVTFLKAKGGEFALKVTVVARAREHIDRVNIIDQLPPLVKIYEKFGGEPPTRVNTKTNRIEWNFNKLEQGESRTLSYVIYSKIGVLGKFALPSATAIYDRDGKIHESQSNKAFFVAEQSKRDLVE